MGKLAKRMVKLRGELESQERLDDMTLFSEWLPILQEMGRPGGKSGREIVEKFTPVGVATIVGLAIKAKDEGVRLKAARDLAWMGGLKPVDRHETFNVSMMAESEVDALLRSTLDDLGLRLVEDKPTKRRGKARVIDANFEVEESAGGAEDRRLLSK